MNPRVYKVYEANVQLAHEAFKDRHREPIMPWQNRRQTARYFLREAKKYRDYIAQHEREESE